MKRKKNIKDGIRNLGLAGLGLGVTVKDKIKKVGKKLAKKGASSKERELFGMKKKQIEQKMKKGIKFASEEALIISKKSLEMLEMELKKLEKQAKKGAKKAARKTKSAVKKAGSRAKSAVKKLTGKKAKRK